MGGMAGHGGGSGSGSGGVAEADQSGASPAPWQLVQPLGRKASLSSLANKGKGAGVHAAGRFGSTVMAVDRNDDDLAALLDNTSDLTLACRI